MDPRIAERRISVTRAAGRRRLRRLLVGLAIVGALGGALGALFSPLLDVDRFDVRGADDRSAEVIAASGIDVGAPLLLVDLARAERSVGALAWVGSVRVDRVLLGTVRIVIEASIPVAWVAGAEGAVTFVDARGRPQAAPEPPPVPAGASVAPVTAGLPELVVADGAGRRTPRAAARVAASLGPLTPRVATITVTDGVVVLGLHAGPEVRFGRAIRLAEKARSAAAVLAAPGIEEAAYLDVSVPAAPVTG